MKKGIPFKRKNDKIPPNALDKKIISFLFKRKPGQKNLKNLICFFTHKLSNAKVLKIMTFQQNLVLKKLTRTDEYLEEVKDLFRFSAEEILADSGKMHIAERLFQLIVDEILDVNQHFIKELNLEAAEDFESTFCILAENKILPEGFANRIAPAVGLRNHIVHRYEKLDPCRFITDFQKDYTDFKHYIKLINQYLEKTAK